MAKKVAAAGPVDGPWTLPARWRWERLGTILPLSYGKALKATERRGGDVPVYGSSGIAGFHDEALCREPALIVGRKGSAGAVFHATGQSYAIDTAYYCSAKAAQFDLRLGYYLLSFLDLRKLDQSTAVPSLSRDPYNGLVVPVPPEDAQPVIAARIDELFAEIDNGEAALARARDDLTTWRKALLKAAVTGELTTDWRAANPPAETGVDLLARILAERRARWEAEPKNKGKSYVEPVSVNAVALAALPSGWTWASLDQVTLNHDGSRIPVTRSDRVLGLYPYYGASGITDWVESYIFDGRHILLSEDGANLLSRTQDIAFIAEGKIWVNNHAHVYSADQHACGDYLAMCLNSLNLAPFVTGTAQPKITKASAARLHIPICSIDEQRQISARVSNMTAAAQTMSAETRSLGDQSDTLRQSILAAAFRGELA